MMPMSCLKGHPVDWSAGRRLLGDQRSVKTPQEQSDEEAEGKPPGKRPPGTEINVVSV